MKLKNRIIVAALLSFAACKKSHNQTHVCECKNPGGVYATYEIKDTKQKAKEICDKHNQEANSIPWSESYCYLK